MWYKRWIVILFTHPYICIEYDGEQHLNSSDFFGYEEEFEKIQKRDKINKNTLMGFQ